VSVFLAVAFFLSYVVFCGWIVYRDLPEIRKALRNWRKKKPVV
jgi:hypothetical protein